MLLTSMLSAHKLLSILRRPFLRPAKRNANLKDDLERLRRANAHLPINRLPTEIIIQVFLFAIESSRTKSWIYLAFPISYPTHSFRLDLMQVCFYWHQTILNAPCAWSSPPPFHGIIPPSLVLRFMERSKAANLHITLAIPGGQSPQHRNDKKKDQSRAKNFEIIMEHVIPHFRRCQSLSVNVGWQEAPQNIFPLRGPLNELRELYLHFGVQRAQFPLLADAHTGCKLERLSIDTPRSLESSFFHNVDTSSIVDITTRFWVVLPDGLDFICQCSQLQSFYFDSDSYEQVGGTPKSSAIYTPKLRKLVIRGPGAMPFLPSWDAPYLDTLEVHTNEQLFSSPDSFLFPNLRSLSFDSAAHHTCDGTNLFQILRNHPSLLHLNFSWERNYFSMVVGVLLHSGVVPSLETISLGAHIDWNANIQEVLKPLFDMRPLLRVCVISPPHMVISDYISNAAQHYRSQLSSISWFAAETQKSEARQAHHVVLLPL